MEVDAMDIPFDVDHIMTAQELIDELKSLDPNQKIFVGYRLLSRAY